MLISAKTYTEHSTATNYVNAFSPHRLNRLSLYSWIQARARSTFQELFGIRSSMASGPTLAPLETTASTLSGPWEQIARVDATSHQPAPTLLGTELGATSRRAKPCFPMLSWQHPQTSFVASSTDTFTDLKVLRRFTVSCLLCLRM